MQFALTSLCGEVLMHDDTSLASATRKLFLKMGPSMQLQFVSSGFTGNSHTITINIAEGVTAMTYLRDDDAGPPTSVLASLPALPQWLLDMQADEDIIKNHDFGLALPVLLTELVQCQKCNLLTLGYGAMANHWVCTLSDDPYLDLVHTFNLAADWEITPQTGLISFPRVKSSGWECFRCSDRQFVMNCGRCHHAFFDGDPELDDDNFRPQLDDNLLWCPNCSVRHGSNYTGG